MHLQKILVVRILIAFAVGGLFSVAIAKIKPFIPEPPSKIEYTEVKSRELITVHVEYANGIEGYLARPVGSEKRPAVILIHEWWGLNADMEALAQKFATEGYVALAVDLYGGETTTEQDRARELATGVRNDPEKAFNNLKSAVAFLTAHENVDPSRIASVGWCFGGGWSYQMARNDLGTRASVMYYGQFDPHDDFSHMRSDILGHFGEDDASITVDSVNEFQAALQTTNGAHEVYIYPHVGHGFANERGGMNPAYNKEAADLAWSRTVEFLTHAFEAE
jgi:carboxymethylenebutenolidase